ncbi:hypothetical protein [Pelagicoccus mobilis]|uniref:Uncharacterized protein n=1 Tax=Pelagicoccus mobilis TaxID=415221 RepID=A0A934RY24_9BACT|nr:hypothetical protein [Pelagicoccus mobilis]MBK1879835.1 hypothetical protein [Pelagicoccus mobilis]
MNSKSLSALLAIAMLALAAYSYKQHAEIGALREQVAQLQTEESETTEPKTPEKPIQVAQAPTPPQLASPLEAPVEAEPTEPTKRKRVMRDFSAMMDNPQMNEMMQASQKATLEIMYKDLLDSYDFTPEERTHLMDLLMARQMFRVETSMKMMGGASSPEEAKLLGEEMKEYDQTIKAEIETFLNNQNDMGEFEFYEKTIAERMSLSGFKSSMAQAGKPITAKTERSLLEIMADQKEAYKFGSDLHDEENYDMGPGRFSTENIDQFETDLSELHNIIAEEAQMLLDPEQLAALVDALEGMRNMQLSQLRMAATMFGGDKQG